MNVSYKGMDVVWQAKDTNRRCQWLLLCACCNDCSRPYSNKKHSERW